MARRISRASVHLYVRANVGRSGDVIRLETFLVHAQVLMRDVDEARAWRVRRRLPILRARRGGTTVARDLRHTCRFLGHVLKSSSLEVDAAGRVDEAERLCRQHLAGLSVDDVEISVAIKTQDETAHAALHV